jgi:Ca2+-dependent lipid-binding protein
VNFVAAESTLHKDETSSRIVLTVRVGKGLASGGLPILVKDIAFQAKVNDKYREGVIQLTSTTF